MALYIWHNLPTLPKPSAEVKPLNLNQSIGRPLRGQDFQACPEPADSPFVQTTGLAQKREVNCALRPKEVQYETIFNAPIIFDDFDSVSRKNFGRQSKD